MKIVKLEGHNSQFGLFDGEICYIVSLEGTENAEFREILEGWLDALEYHEFKSRGYKNRRIFSLGIRGEFVGFWRKAQKLYSSIWEKEGLLVGEGVQEVLMDTFGSLGLMLHDYRKSSDKYSARWRDNHSNRPTFGPGPEDAIRVQGRGVLEAIKEIKEIHKHEYIGRPSMCVCGKNNPSPDRNPGY